ncbi:hypothetical protein [Microbacterium sp. JB110]|uniref:hypothetical protein n=1 Tax=Microbacterium sp. JB110 TaxID=2024477 RepID=UPI00097EFBC4|nr:hypothetical protein [Microbacterium sp. JB110]RCS63220.1 hypothetical protein CIK77_03335 [Microbacterium sp. JB110]SJM52205.1 hypothetical protein CZ774_05490 [Frigoribacterium sp. JB110]
MTATSSAENLAQVTRLRERITAMQQRRATPETLPVPGPLSPVFPDGGLRTGAAYSLAHGETGLMLALLAEASAAGSWCCVIGVPELSVGAAEGHGIDLSRLVLIPTPQERWMQAAAAACEVFPLVALRPGRRPTPGDAQRLEARMRDRGSSLLTLGEWPGAEGTVSAGEEEWVGIGRGHGLISGRTVTVSLHGRRTPRPRSVRVMLPGPNGRVQAIAPAQARPLERGGTALRAVGS